MSAFSRDNPSPRFRELLEQYRAMHRVGDPSKGVAPEKMFDGRSLPRQAHRIRKLVARTQAESVLDYGSGKGTQYRDGKILENGVARWNNMREYWGVHSIRCYDPGYEPFAALPEASFDGVICTDVLEHCPEEDLPWIVAELFGFARRFVFANVACYPAIKTLPNGENAHCTIRPVDYWGGLFEAAATRSPGVLWEVWADTQKGNALAEARIGNFEALPFSTVAAAGGVPPWRMV